jgi:hypothetical protein
MMSQTKNPYKAEYSQSYDMLTNKLTGLWEIQVAETALKNRKRQKQM